MDEDETGTDPGIEGDSSVGEGRHECGSSLGVPPLREESWPGFLGPGTPRQGSFLL